jgi:hypothetical protein
MCIRSIFSAICLRVMIVVCSVTSTTLSATQSQPLEFDENESLSGLYRAVLQHDRSQYYQFADIHFRAVSAGDGRLKISPNVKIYLRDWDSNEYLTYEFDDCAFNLIARQISIKNDVNDISLSAQARSGGVFDGACFLPARF